MAGSAYKTVVEWEGMKREISAYHCCSGALWSGRGWAKRTEISVLRNRIAESHRQRTRPNRSTMHMWYLPKPPTKSMILCVRVSRTMLFIDPLISWAARPCRFGRNKMLLAVEIRLQAGLFDSANSLLPVIEAQGGCYENEEFVANLRGRSSSLWLREGIQDSARQ